MKTLVLSAVSAASVLVTYCIIFFTHPEDPEYAGSGFSWTVTHFLPAAFVSSILWLVALCLVIGARKKVASQPFSIRIAPRLLLLPYLIFVGHLGLRLTIAFYRSK